MKNSEYTRKLNFEVVTKPVSVMGNVYGKKKAIVNDQNGEIISIMSSSYNLFNNERFMELGQRISDSLGLPIEHYASHQHGKKVLVAFKNTERFEILGHEFKDNIVLFDTRDGSTKLSGGSNGTIFRCSNMFKSTDVKFGIRHNSKLDQMVFELEAELEVIAIKRNLHIERLEKLADIPVVREDVYQFLSGWIDFSPKDIADIAHGRLECSTKASNIVNGVVNSWNTETKDLGKNGFGFHNAITHYFSNNRGKGQKELFFGDFGRKDKQAILFAESLA